MDFEWDEIKSEGCFTQRGFDFAYATQAFFDPDRLIRSDLRHNYGEDRFQLLGQIDHRVFMLA
ncbi:MAG: BrnT family toxin [Hydrogenophaga sp.]